MAPERDLDCTAKGQAPHRKSLMHRYLHALMMSTIFHTMKTICKRTSVLEFTANRNDGALRDVLVECLSPLLILVVLQVNRKSTVLWHCAYPASTTRAEHRKLPKSMMIGKALLSGLWAHRRAVSLSVSHPWPFGSRLYRLKLRRTG